MSLDLLEITLAKIRFQGPSQGNASGHDFVIGQASNGTTVKGCMQKPVVGERYRLWGDWVAQKPYNGRSQPDAFVFEHHESVIDQSEAGVANYLRVYVDGLGPVKATALVEHFAADTLHVLRTTPERAAEVHGISEANVEAIRKHFAEQSRIDPVAYAALADMFGPYKIPKKVILSLLDNFGSDAPQVVQDRPYLLLAFPRLGWKVVDSFAVATAKYPADGIERHAAAIVEALERIALEGHTYATRIEIEKAAFEFLGSRPIAASWDAVQAEDMAIREIVDNQETYALPKLYDAEHNIAQRLATLSAIGNPLPFSLPDEGLLTEQIEALRLIERHPVVILAGAPGTGKTYTITRALAGLVANGFHSIRAVAPTGKAAKRTAELLEKALPNSGIISSTIHRALGPVPSTEPAGIPREQAKHGRGREEFGFARGSDCPIDAQVIVPDETSMLDAKLGSSLLSAVANGSRLIFVGDPHQLPSIGPGSVLRDMIAGGVPTATLTEIQRNSGAIVRACHAILGGKVPQPCEAVDFAKGENWIHLEIGDPTQINEEIVALHESAKKNGQFDPLWDMQVISPEKKKPGVGCNAHNKALSNLLNTYKKVDPNKIYSDDEGLPPKFERGDKVIRTKNGIADQLLTPAQAASLGGDPKEFFAWDGEQWMLVETDIVNGDMGIVLDIDKSKSQWQVIVRFRTPDRLCRLPYGDCYLELAYAITAHKAQGSDYPYVILPVHESFYSGMWTREMAYTEFSRARNLLVTVGPFSTIEAAIRRPTVHRRKTRLRSLVAHHFAKETALVGT